MCGSYVDTMICLKANSDLILQIICLMNETEKSCDDKDPLALGDNNNTDNNNSATSCDNPEEFSLCMSPDKDRVRYLPRSRLRSKGGGSIWTVFAPNYFW